MKKLLIALLIIGMSNTVTIQANSFPTMKIQEKQKKKDKKKKQKTAQQLLEELKQKNANVTDILVWDESTDINELLGRPGQYIGKADFSDARVAEYWTTEEERVQNGLNGGTIEVFKSKKDCSKRNKYLSAFLGADLGVMGLNQYVYKYDKVIFRVSYDVVPSEAEIYKQQMDEILGEKGKELKPENK